VNLYGVLYGALSAYPIMAGQGLRPHREHRLRGRPDPLAMNAPYSTTKHAVVGSVAVYLPDAVKDSLRVKMVEPARAVREILDGVARNSEVIIFPASIRAMRRLHFFFPRLISAPMRRAVQDARQQRILS